MNEEPPQRPVLSRQFWLLFILLGCSGAAAGIFLCVLLFLLSPALADHVGAWVLLVSGLAAWQAAREMTVPSGRKLAIWAAIVAIGLPLAVVAFESLPHQPPAQARKRLR